MVVFETFALMKFLKREKGHDQVRKMLQQGGYVSEATLYELFYVVTRDFKELGHDSQESIRKAEEVIDSLSIHLRKQHISSAIMRKSISFKLQYNKLNPSHFDCLALATADVLQQPLCSGEKGLAQVKEVKVFE